MMPSMFLGTFFYLFLFSSFATSSESKFAFNGFSGAELGLDGNASIASNGLLSLTNNTMQYLELGHAFHQTPLNFKSPVGKILSFSTTLVFAISSQYSYLSGHGIAFVISPTTNFSTALPAQFLGLFNSENDGNSSNHILAVELDTVQNPEFQDIDDNHVGIDVSSLTSVSSHTAGYYVDKAGGFKDLTLHSGQPMQVWVDFDAEVMQLNVTMSPLQTPKPSRPLLSSLLNLSSVMLDSMYVGFSSATGSIPTSHYILGWSFTMNGEAEPLDYAKLPQLAHLLDHSRNFNKLAIWLPLVICSFILMVLATLVFLIRRRAKYAELLEDWEREYVTHRFPYKDLFRATRGFNAKELVGVGGFGSVFRGVLPSSNREVAVKRVSHESGSQGMKEFVAEIVSIGQLRHRNIAQLLGYCRRKGELLLVYDLMPNSSLDKYLYDHSKPTLDWARRFGIIKGVASALIYLHEEWERVVIHRDIKASNVLLDGEWTAKLGDFGLARSCQHGIDPRSTRVIGTIGYLAPELSRTGRSSTMTDVFAFGAFLLEVACGRRPLVLEAQGEKLVLVDWVRENWKEGTVLATMDPRLAEEGSVALAEIEMVLILGLLCSHPVPEARPSMRQVTRFLDGDETLPELSPANISYNYPSLIQNNAIYGDYM